MHFALLVLLLQTVNVEVLLQQAREAARTDQNARSADLFEEVLKRDPSRRRDILREYADQLTYSNRSTLAVPLYREVLLYDDQYRTRIGLALALSWSGQHAEAIREYDIVLTRHPADLEAWLGKARVLSWMGRLAESQREYESLLRDHPNNAEALRGLVRVLTWRGRQRQATRVLIDLLSRNPSDREARFLLAEAQHWLGRDDRAYDALQLLLQQSPLSERERNLEKEVLGRTGPESLLGVARSTQSDDVDITAGAFQHVHRLWEGLSAGMIFASTVDYESVRGPTVRVDRPGLGFRHRFSDPVELNVRLFQDQISSGTIDHSPTTHDAWLTVWPNDYVRTDFSSNRGTLDNIPSLQMGITVRSLGGSIDVLPTERLRLTARTSAAAYSDGNERRASEGEVEFKLPLRRTTLVGLRAQTFEFERLLNHGYFNPLDYFSISATGKTRGPLGARIWTEADGSFGHEQVDPGSSKWIYSARLRLEYRVGEDSYLDLRLESFTSRLDSPSGFSRDTLGLSFRHLW